MAKSILVDSGFLYELYDQNAPRHTVAQDTVSSYGLPLLIPYVVLTETAFLFRRAGGTEAVRKFLLALADATPYDDTVS
jgi:predicted nucleic acid-binding protein